MKVENYIAQLLYRYQCVTVPGFGAFLTEIKSAQMHQNSHSFYPPKKIVSFNGYLKNNDGLLANHIAQTEKMAYETAVSIIENQVVAWKNKLQEIGSISLQNIGEIKLNPEKNIVFYPAEQINYYTHSFGLSAFVSPAIKREVYKQEVEQLEEKAPILITPQKKENYSLLKYAALFVLGAGILTAGGFFGKNYYDAKIEQETLAVQTKVQQKVTQKIQEATFFIENPIPSVLITVENNLNNEAVKLPYHVVAGAFREEKNANKALRQLQQLGYNARKLERNKYGLFPVLYGSFSSYLQAEKIKQNACQNHNPEAWILIEEL